MKKYLNVLNLLIVGLVGSVFPMVCLAALIDESIGESEQSSLALSDSELSHHCSRPPIGIARTDYFIDTLSTLPHYYGLPARLQVRQVSPVYRHGRDRRCPVYAAVFPNTGGIDSVAAFDLPYGDYSLLEALAWAGIDTFALNLLGWGLSDRFVMDDPCSASPMQQETLLIPNPLQETCPSPDPFSFTTTAAMQDQLDALVNDIQSRLGVSQVTLFGYSAGGHVSGNYARAHPAKVKNIILLASAGYLQPTLPPDPLPQPGFSIGVLQSRPILFDDRWGGQLDEVACPGQRDPAILDPVWQAIRESDPVASDWGPTDPDTGRPGGLLRAPKADVWGWNYETAPEVTAPVLILSGLSDTIVPTDSQVGFYNAMGSSTKVLVKMACASHFLVWEGSASPTWGGPHVSLRDATIEWITSETYQGARRGIFQVHADGRIDGPF